MTGVTGSSDFPTPNGWDTSYNGFSDAFVSKFSGSGQLIWCTYLGGRGMEPGSAVWSDGANNVCVAGWTTSTDFPTPNGWDTSYNGGNYDAFVSKFEDVPVPLRIKDQRGSAMAEVDGAGNLFVAGSITQRGVPTRGPGSEFVVKGPIGSPVAVINAGGNLVLAGTLYQNQGTLTPPANSFVVKNGAGEVLAYIDPAGNMYLRGTAYSGS